MLSSKTHVVSCINTQRLHSQLNLSSGPPTECNNILSVTGFNASSSSGNTGSSPDALPQLRGSTDHSPWMELELSDRSTITGRRFKLRSYGLVPCFWKPFFSFSRCDNNRLGPALHRVLRCLFQQRQKKLEASQGCFDQREEGSPSPNRRGLSLRRRFPW